MTFAPKPKICPYQTGIEVGPEVGSLHFSAGSREEPLPLTHANVKSISLRTKAKSAHGFLQEKQNGTWPTSRMVKVH